MFVREHVDPMAYQGSPTLELGAPMVVIFRPEPVCRSCAGSSGTSKTTVRMGYRAKVQSRAQVTSLIE